jgi:hypothetical protein
MVEGVDDDQAATRAYVAGAGGLGERGGVVGRDGLLPERVMGWVVEAGAGGPGIAVTLGNILVTGAGVSRAGFLGRSGRGEPFGWSIRVPILA